MSKKTNKSKKRVKGTHNPRPKVVSFNWKPALLVSLIAFVLYGNTLQHQFAFDDAIVITENKFTQKGFAGISELATSDFFKGTFDEKGDELSGGRYRPLSLVMFAAEAQLFGEPQKEANGQIRRNDDGDILYDYPAQFGHWVNVLFYALCCYLLYYLLFLWFGQRKELVAVPFVAALLFAVHPVHSEVVANIKSRDEILSLFFLLGTLIFWHRWLKNQSNKKALWFGLGAFLLSLLAKETPFTYIAIFPLIDWVVYRTPKKELIKRSWLLWLVAIGYLVLRTSMVGLPQPSVNTTGILDNPFATSDMAEKLATISLICWRYVMLLVAPITMRCDYSFEHVPFATFGHPEALMGVLLYGSMIVAAIVLLKKRSIYSLVIVMFLFPLSVVTNLFFNIGATMGERFLFVPSLAFALLVALLLVKYMKLNSLKVQANAGWAVLILYGMFFSYKTFARNPDWKNNDTLFTKDVETTPKSAKMQNYQARILFEDWREGNRQAEDRPLLEQAKYHYDRSVQIYKDYLMSYYDLGMVNLYLGNKDESLAALHNALKLNYQHGLSHELLGQVHYRMTKDYNKAAFHLRYAVERLDRKRATALRDLGVYYATAGKGDSAVMYLQQSLDMDPNNLMTLKNTSVILRQLGRPREADEYARRAAALEAKQP